MHVTRRQLKAKARFMNLFKQFRGLHQQCGVKTRNFYWYMQHLMEFHIFYGSFSIFNYCIRKASYFTQFIGGLNKWQSESISLILLASFTAIRLHKSSHKSYIKRRNSNIKTIDHNTLIPTSGLFLFRE